MPGLSTSKPSSKPRSKPSPDTLPIDASSVASDNLSRINQANRLCHSCLQAWEAAKAETKDRKAEYEDAINALQSLIVKLCGPPPASVDDEPLPLIDGADEPDGVDEPDGADESDDDAG